MSNSITESAWLMDRLQQQLPTPALQWFEQRRQKLAAAWSLQDFYISFGMMPRKLGKAPLALPPAERAAADQLRSGWRPDRWSLADAGRVVLLLTAQQHDNMPFPTRFSDLCRNADVGELLALYRGLPLYPQPPALSEQVGEGLRSNIQAVFEAIAQDNPYPREYFQPARWNQMILKALFIGSPLHRIQGLDERANAELAQTLSDYLHERWAAGRPVSLELWRCLGPFAKDAMLEDVARALAQKDPAQRQAAALALASNPCPQAQALLQKAGELQQQIQSGALTWRSLYPLIIG